MNNTNIKIQIAPERIEQIKLLFQQMNIPFDLNNSHSEVPNQSDNLDELDSLDELESSSSEDIKESDLGDSQNINSTQAPLDLDSNTTESDELNEGDMDFDSHFVPPVANPPLPKSAPNNPIESVLREIPDEVQKVFRSKINSSGNNEESKITLNVGGKKFHFNEKLLKRLNIDYSKLGLDFFLDKDPYYFSQIIDIIRKNGTDSSDIALHVKDYSEQLISELCFYTLLDPKYSPSPKLKLKKSVGFTDGVNSIVKIVIGKQIFYTTDATLSRSTYFSKIITNKNPIINLSPTEIDSKIFRYILNFLRQKEMYVTNTIIEAHLNKLGIEYDLIEKKRIYQNIIPCYEPYSSVAYSTEIPEKYHQKIQSNEKNKISYKTENINIINTNNKLEFGSDIIFDLGSVEDSIEDLVLSIDVPVLKPTDNIEYIDFFEYMLIENLNLILTNSAVHTVLLSSSNCYQYMYPIIYTNNPKEYHFMTKLDGRKMKIIYQNNLIDINRIILPLFLFGKHALPIHQLKQNNQTAHLVVKMAPLNKLLKNNSGKPLGTIPLLNICLMATCTRSLSTNKISSQIYERLHTTIVPIQSTTNPIYDVVTIPLEKIGFVKDFFFTIIKKEDYVSNIIDRFVDELIDIEILYVHDGKVSYHTKADAMVLNSYLPLKKLGHKLPLGVYYYSFSPNPLGPELTGGLNGKSYVLRMRTKKIDGVVKFYANEYFLQVF
jgi:hypothetical protein